MTVEPQPTIAELQAENARLRQGLAVALEQQVTISEVLRVIAGSPTDLQAVLDAVAENAARLCGADDAMIRRADGNQLRLAAHYGPVDVAFETQPIDRGAIGGRAVIEQRTVHVPDLLAEPADEYPIATSRGLTHLRSVLATPMLSQGTAIGVILVRHAEVRPFTQQHIDLLETFADQAVIAIENSRLFQELEDPEKSTSSMRKIAGPADRYQRGTAGHQPLGIRSGADSPDARTEWRPTL